MANEQRHLATIVERILKIGQLHLPADMPKHVVEDDAIEVKLVETFVGKRREYTGAASLETRVQGGSPLVNALPIRHRNLHDEKTHVLQLKKLSPTAKRRLECITRLNLGGIVPVEEKLVDEHGVPNAALHGVVARRCRAVEELVADLAALLEELSGRMQTGAIRAANHCEPCLGDATTSGDVAPRRLL